MTSHERILKAAKREPADVLPVAPYMGNFGTAAGGGFILGSGCEVTVKTPHENIKTMIRTAREYKY